MSAAIQAGPENRRASSCCLGINPTPRMNPADMDQNNKYEAIRSTVPSVRTNMFGYTLRASMILMAHNKGNQEIPFLGRSSFLLCSVVMFMIVLLGIA